MPSLAATREHLAAVYRRRTPKSAAMHEQARRVLPGGDTRSTTFFKPYPVFVERAEGQQLYDLDGNAFPPALEAARKQLARGTAWAAPNEHLVGLATLICERVPSVEKIRFTNSGTEATLQTIRSARACTGRDVILKIEGGYHGIHDAVSVSIETNPARAGSPTRR